MLRDLASRCPYCGEALRVEVDLSEGLPQRFVWDCSVCCRPIEVAVREGAGGEPVMRVTTEDEPG